MNHYYEIDPRTLTDEQSRVHEVIASGPRGLVAAPFKVWLHCPQLAETAQALGAYCRYGTSLKPRLSELAIVTVGARWAAGFEWVTHEPLARQAGVSTEVLEAIRTGRQPLFAQPDEAAVYDFSTALLTKHCVSPDVFGRTEEAIGKAGVVDLTGILGYYTLISMTIRAFRIPIPDGETDPFPG